MNVSTKLSCQLCRYMLLYDKALHYSYYMCRQLQTHEPITRWRNPDISSLHILSTYIYIYFIASYINHSYASGAQVM